MIPLSVWIYSLISVALVSLISLVGVLFLSFGRQRLQKLLVYLVSFAVGGLFGDAFIHLLPEAFRNNPNSFWLPVFILSGIFIFFITEKVIRWRHCHIPDHSHDCRSAAMMNLVGDSVHNFLDGVLIAASFITSLPLGLATTMAVILHEIPQEIGDFGVFVHAGYSVKKALLFNFFSALTAVLGTILALIIGESITGFSTLMIPLAAGGFIYIAGSDLIPELHHDNNWRSSLKQLLAMLLGVGLMLLLLLAG